MLLMEKALELSMRMMKSKNRMIRFGARIISAFPIWYSERMERKLFEGKWDPGKKYRKKRH